jgi:hypothetical protein
MRPIRADVPPRLSATGCAIEVWSATCRLPSRHLFDLVFDVRLGTFAVVADSPTFHVRVSSDAGVTFASEVNPPGSEFFSDWAIGNGTIFVSSFSGAFGLIHLAALS